MKPGDLALLRTPGVPTLSPSGDTAVVSVSRMDLETDEYRAELWNVDTAGSTPPRQLTHGWRDTAPVYSPDGTQLAFLRAQREPGAAAGKTAGKAAKTGKPQIWVMPTGGGEPRCLTDHPLGAGAPVWSPTSDALAYVARVPEEGRYGTDESITPDKEKPRRITKAFYRVDGVGYLGDRPAHVFVVQVSDDRPQPRQVTDGGYDHKDVAWSPAGDLLAFAAARHDTDDLVTDVFVTPPAGGAPRRLTRGDLASSRPEFTPDASAVCFTANVLEDNGRRGVCRNSGLWSVAVDGSAPPVRLTDAERFDIASHPPVPVRIVDKGAIVAVENRGAIDAVLVPFGGGEPEVLVSGHRQVHGIDATADGSVVVSCVSDPGSMGELVVADRVLTSFGAGTRLDLRPMEEITADAPDGYPVHGWVLRPTGDGPHPVLLLIHGGPFTQYGWTLFDEAQVYAGAGYAVVMGNPRGSSGYGEAHGRAVIGNVGEVSAADLLALLDAALAVDDLDGSRVGVLGGSHGGFMTTWLAAHHGDRFKAAISERAVNAIDSFHGSSDIGWFFADDLYGDDWAGQSPLTYADRISIPMMIIHSENDWRCPVEQAQRLFVALRRRGVETEMLLFPGEGHELTRSGLPSHRVARFEAIVEWFGRHLASTGP